MTPLSGRQWGVVLQISLPVILLDEALKYLSRYHVDGEWEPSTPSLPTSASRLQQAVPASASVAVGDMRGSEAGARAACRGRGPGSPWVRCSGPCCLAHLSATSPARPGSQGLPGLASDFSECGLSLPRPSQDSLPGLRGQRRPTSPQTTTGRPLRCHLVGGERGGSLSLDSQL